MKSKRITSIVLAIALVCSTLVVDTTSSSAETSQTLGTIKIGTTQTITHTGTGASYNDKTANLYSFKTTSGMHAYGIHVECSNYNGGYELSRSTDLNDDTVFCCADRYDSNADISYYVSTDKTNLGFRMTPDTEYYIALYGNAGDTFSVTVTELPITTSKYTIKTKFTTKKVKRKSLKKKSKKILIEAYAKESPVTSVGHKLVSYPKNGKKYAKLKTTLEGSTSLTLKKNAPKGTYKIRITKTEDIRSTWENNGISGFVYYTTTTKDIKVKVV